MKGKNCFVLNFLFFCLIFNSCSFILNNLLDPEPDPIPEPDPVHGTGATETPSPSGQGTKEETPVASSYVADQYFWGTWIRMDNGEEYDFQENLVTTDSAKYAIISGNSEQITVYNLGTFSRQSDSVMVTTTRYVGASTDSTIPLFRKGGANLDYKLRLVGFDSDARAAVAVSSSGRKGLRVTGTSNTYTSYKSDDVSDADGYVNLKAPVAGDAQTVVVTNGNDKIRVTGIKVLTDGSNLGTIPIAGENEYSLKITGTVNESEKDSGYLYAGRSYNMELSIENISKIKSGSSVAVVKPRNPEYVTVVSTDGTDLDGFPISTLTSGAKKTVRLKITCGTFSEPYVDTELAITVTSSGSNGRTWEDVVPIRIFRGQMPVVIAAKSTENNTNAKLNGFMIYPDGNNTFFSVSDGSSNLIYVPTFKASEYYMMAFCGASSSQTLSESTEMFYTVHIDSREKVPVVTSGNNLISYMDYGELTGKNETETSAYQIDSSNTTFEAYLAADDMDFYKISVQSTSQTFYGDAAYYNLNSSSVQYNAITLSWTLGTGKNGDTLYVYKDDTKIGSVSSSDSEFTVTDLDYEKEYTFQLKTASGVDISNSITVTTAAPPPLRLSALSIMSKTITLKFENPEGKSGYIYLFKDNAYYTGVSYTAEDTEKNITVTGLSTSTYYTFVLKTALSSGEEISNTIKVTTKAASSMTGTPSVSGIVTYNTSTNKYSYAEINWTRVTGATKYMIYEYTSSSSSLSSSTVMKLGVLLTTTSNLTFTDTSIEGISCSRNLYYVVVPVDSNGEEGNPSSPNFFRVSS